MASDKERGPEQASADIEKFLDILAKDPKSRVFAPLAEAYRKAGFLDDAVATALEGLKVHPNYLGGRVALGRAYFEKSQLAEAAAEMTRVVRAAPENIIAHKVLGQIAHLQGDLPAAQKSFRMVLILDPRDQDAQEFVAALEGGAPVPAPARPMPAPPPVRAPPAAPPAEVPTPLPPAAPSPIPFEALSFDEIQPLDEIELEPAPAAPAPEMPPIEFAAFADDLPAVRVQGEPPDAPAAEAPPAGPGRPLHEVRPEAAGDADESPIETFGRPLRGGPPASTKGEEPRDTEFDIEVLSAVPPEPPPPAPSGAEPEFEVFTREPGPRTPAGPARSGRGEFSGPREEEIETTAYNPPETFVPVADDASVLELDEELPRIDLASEVDFEEAEESAPAAEPLAEDVGDIGHIGDIRDIEDIEDVEYAGDVADIAAVADFAKIEDIEDVQDIEDIEDVEPVTAGAAAAEREVFGTATLADIYIKQGFFGRAAQIYRRLIEQRPDDAELHRKLEAVLALEAGAAATGPQVPEAAPVAPEPSPVVPAPVPTAAGPAAAGRDSGAASPAASRDEKIRRLETLLEAFKGGQPR